MRHTKNILTEAIEYTPVSPNLHSSATLGKESAPLGNQAVFLQTEVSKMRNLLPSVKKLVMSAGNKNPGQKKEAGIGVITKSQDVIYERRREAIGEKRLV
jgi:hypothetical protein